MRFKEPRFTVRAMLVAITVASLFLAYVGAIISELQTTQEHHQAISWTYRAAVTQSPIQSHRWLHPFLPDGYVSKIDSVALYAAAQNDSTVSELVPHINAFDSLKQLTLQEYSSVTDDGLAELIRLDRLEQLNLQGPQFSDAGLEHLAKVKTLKSLTLERTSATQSGIDMLKRALPGCQVSAR